MSLSEHFFDKPVAIWQAEYELQKEELYPYSKGEWLQLKPEEENLKQDKKYLLDGDTKTEQHSTSDTSVDEDKDKEENEEKEEDEVGESEHYGFKQDKTLRGPIWNYGLRKMSLESDYFRYLLYRVRKESLKTPDELVLRGTKWSAPKPITSSMAVYLLKRLKKMIPENTAMVELETGRTMTYRELAEKAESLAWGLHWHGLQPGQIMAIVSFNSIEALLMILACLLLGTIVALVDSSLSPIELSVILRTTGPHVVFTELGKTRDKVETALGYLTLSLQRPKPQLIINSTTLPKSNNYFLFSQMFKEVDPQQLIPGPKRADPLRPVMILYTGTPESPKSCLIPERYFTHSKAFRGTVLPTSDEPSVTVMATTPLFYSLTIKTILNNLIDGHRFLINRGQIPEPFLITTLRKFEVFAILTTQRTLRGLLDWPARPRCPNLKLVAITGMPLRQKNFLLVHSDLFNKKVILLQLYDLVELGVVSQNTLTENKPGSVGKLHYNVHMKVLEEGTGMSLGPNQEGELCVRAPTMFLEYYSYNNLMVDKDVLDKEGFLHTGDLGYYDDEGYVYVIDKVGDMIKWRTYIVSPSLVEAVLLEQPEVKEALVFGVFDEEEGQLVTAAVIFEFGYEHTDLAAFVKQVNALLPYPRKIRGGVHVYQQFPRSSIGKAMKELVFKEVMERMLVTNRHSESNL